MKQGLTLAVALLLLLVACKPGKRNTAHNPYLEQLQQIADNTGLSSQERLNAALLIDSLVGREPPDTVRLNNQLNIGLLYLKMDSMKQAQSYFRSAVQLSTATNATQELAIAHNGIAIVFNAQSAYDSALLHYEIAYRLFSQQQDTLKAAQALVNTGIAYKNKGAWEPAFKKTLAAAAVFRQVNANRELAYCYTTMGNILRELKRYEEALGYHRQALQVRISQNDSSGIAVCLNNIGNIYREQHQPDTALVYYLQSYAIKKKEGKPQTIATALDNIAETNLELGRTIQAETYFKQALDIRNTIQDREGYIVTANRLANLYLATNRLDRARELARVTGGALPDSGFSQQRLEYILVQLQIAVREGDYKSATGYSRQALALKDQIFSANLSEAVTRMNAEFQTTEQRKALEASRSKEESGRKLIRQQRVFIFSLGLLITLLLAVIYLLYRSNQLRKAANHRIALLKSELEHSVDNKLQRLSMMLLQQMNATQNDSETNILKNVRAKVQAMIIVHTTLYKNERYQGLVHAADIIRPLLENLPLVFEKQAGTIPLYSRLEDYEIPVSDALTLGLIINELLTNIYKHTTDFTSDTYVRITLTRAPVGYTITVSDNGPAWKYTTDQEKGKGLQLIELLTAQLGGHYHTGREGEENKSIIYLEQKQTD